MNQDSTWDGRPVTTSPARANRTAGSTALPEEPHHGQRQAHATPSVPKLPLQAGAASRDTCTKGTGHAVIEDCVHSGWPAGRTLPQSPPGYFCCCCWTSEPTRECLSVARVAPNKQAGVPASVPVGLVQGERRRTTCLFGMGGRALDRTLSSGARELGELESPVQSETDTLWFLLFKGFHLFVWKVRVTDRE